MRPGRKHGRADCTQIVVWFYFLKNPAVQRCIRKNKVSSTCVVVSFFFADIRISKYNMLFRPSRLNQMNCFGFSVRKTRKSTFDQVTLNILTTLLTKWSKTGHVSQKPAYLALCLQPPSNRHFVPFAHHNRRESEWMGDTPANGGRH